MRKGVQEQCVNCGKININNYWYKPGQTPPHHPHYRGAMCPECRQKKLKPDGNAVETEKRIAASKHNPETVSP
ncbi:MAG: hypothetical protein Q4F84_02980 [Fibrobacter sp.]|nr:hypothetical protein [Fibrobacter sp.]